MTASRLDHRGLQHRSVVEMLKSMIFSYTLYTIFFVSRIVFMQKDRLKNQQMSATFAVSEVVTSDS